MSLQSSLEVNSQVANSSSFPPPYTLCTCLLYTMLALQVLYTFYQVVLVLRSTHNSDLPISRNILDTYCGPYINQLGLGLIISLSLSLSFFSGLSFLFLPLLFFCLSCSRHLRFLSFLCLSLSLFWVKDALLLCKNSYSSGKNLGNSYAAD